VDSSLGEKLKRPGDPRKSQIYLPETKLTPKTSFKGKNSSSWGARQRETTKSMKEGKKRRDLKHCSEGFSERGRGRALRRARIISLEKIEKTVEKLLEVLNLSPEEKKLINTAIINARENPLDYDSLGKRDNEKKAGQKAQNFCLAHPATKKMKSVEISKNQVLRFSRKSAFFGKPRKEDPRTNSFGESPSRTHENIMDDHAVRNHGVMGKEQGEESKRSENTFQAGTFKGYTNGRKYAGSSRGDNRGSLRSGCAFGGLRHRVSRERSRKALGPVRRKEAQGSRN